MITKRGIYFQEEYTLRYECSKCRTINNLLMRSKKKTHNKGYSIVEQAEKVTSQYEIEILKKEVSATLDRLVHIYRRALHNKDWSEAIKILQVYISQPTSPMHQEPRKNLIKFIRKSQEWIEKTKTLFEIE